MSDLKRVHAFVNGRVQGVGFRYFTQRVAQMYGIVGEVKNKGDGRVEIIAEGDEKVLKKFLDQIKKGPTLSYVSSLDADWSHAGGKYTRFDITY